MDSYSNGTIKHDQYFDGSGWYARGDYVPSDAKRRPFNRPTFRQFWLLLPMLIRFLIYLIRVWWHGRGRFIDFMMQHKPFYGVPCGGIGCGGIGRDFRGGFCKYSLRPGVVEQHVDCIKANQFIVSVRDGTNRRLLYQRVLSTADFPEHPLASWDTTFPKESLQYRGLYPRSWSSFTIDALDLVLICRQISPIIPNNYKDSSLPTTIFVWDIINESATADYTISIAFTFRNGTGDKRWRREGKCSAKMFVTSDAAPPISGICLSHKIDSMNCSYFLAAKQDECKSITTTTFDPLSDGADLWNELLTNGHFSNGTQIQDRNEMGVAICLQTNVNVKCTTRSLEFALVWHMPVVHFGGKERIYRKRYSRYFGVDTSAGIELAAYALAHFTDWETAIDNWQHAITTSSIYPDWYKSAIFNELYFLTDGGTFWMEFDDTWPQRELQMSSMSMKHFEEYGRFGYLESWEYHMVNTYDVHFYASWALLMNWPKIEMSLQLDFTDQIMYEDKRSMTSLSENALTFAKRYGRLPHDMGHPDDGLIMIMIINPAFTDPWLYNNAYMLHDTGDWKDLNLKFILNAYRDFIHISDRSIDFLNHCYPAISYIIRDGIERWDTDRDGLIENSGFADQTYDMWVMTGSSAYCGSLWIAALYCAEQTAECLRKDDDAKLYAEIRRKATESFNRKLWTGDYYRFDEHADNRDTLMADQLCGIWFIKMIDAGVDLLPPDNVLTALNTVYNNNVCKFDNGSMGPVNGIKLDGSLDRRCVQGNEVWTGVGYSVASFLIQQGKLMEGFHTAQGIYDSCWLKIGLQYQTPEAIYRRRFYRAIGYMRPLAVWSMQWSLDNNSRMTPI